MSIATLLLHANHLLTAIVLIVSFSLMAYIALQNRQNSVARALCVLLACVVIVNAGDILLARASRAATIQFLLRTQWLGIAFVPAGYIHLAQALYRANYGPHNPRRLRPSVWLGYMASACIVVLTLQTNLVVSGNILKGSLAQFGAGPLFWVYGAFFVLGGSIVLWAIVQSRQAALTPTMRRRMTYLGATFAAPGLGVFPYLVIAGVHTSLSTNAILIFSSLVSVGVMGMITVMTYSVAFQGVLLPDRLIKQDFIRWGLYGPVVGVTIILCIQVVPYLERVFGLPSDTLITFSVMIMTVLMPLFVSRVRPYLDALIYRQDRAEIDYLRNLPRSTFTRTDLRQLLENVLITICGAMRVETGFVIGPGDDGYTVKAVCGSRRAVKRFVLEQPIAALIPQLERMPANDINPLPPTSTFMVCNGFCLLPLRSSSNVFLGALGVPYDATTWQQEDLLTPSTRRLISVLAHQMELAIETVQMQQHIFDTLRGLGPEMQSLQQLSTQLEQATPASLTSLTTDVVLQPEFPQLVKDALTQFWGGPKLSDSPLLDLRAVRRLLQHQGGSPTRALQAVLRQAIDNMRPDDQLDPSAQEWLLYNLLEGRFLQRKPVRDVAQRLSMSESDFYRKQRIAVEEVARQLTLMEDGE